MHVPRTCAHAAQLCFNSVSNRVVTIGPLIVLVLLGVTFQIGARLARPVEANVLPIPQARSIDQSDISVLPTMEPLPPTPGLQRARTPDVPTEDISREMELSKFGSAIQRGKVPGGSRETIVLSRSLITTSAGAFAGQHRPAGRVLEASGTNSRQTNSHEPALSHQDTETEHTTRGETGSSATAIHGDAPLNKPRRSLGSGLTTGTGIKADQKRVHAKVSLTM